MTTPPDVDASEIAAVTDWMAALGPQVGKSYGAELVREGGSVAVLLPGADTRFFNRVLGLGVFEPATRTLVRDIVARYRDADVRFMVHLTESARPESLADWLAEEGLTPQGEWITLYREAAPVAAPTTELRVERVGRTQAGVFARTLCSGYGMPDEWADLYVGIVGREQWVNYLAMDGDLPVATSSIFLHPPFAWCGNSAVLREYRRRGAHTALSRIRLEDGIAGGVRTFTGETWQQVPGGRPNQSLRNHTRDGWQFCQSRTNYAEPAEPFDD
jgi:hypothetical protein